MPVTEKQKAALLALKAVFANLIDELIMRFIRRAGTSFTPRLGLVPAIDELGPRQLAAYCSSCIFYLLSRLCCLREKW
jgi:hypothetical protein